MPVSTDFRRRVSRITVLRYGGMAVLIRSSRVGSAFVCAFEVNELLAEFGLKGRLVGYFSQKIPKDCQRSV